MRLGKVMSAHGRVREGDGQVRLGQQPIKFCQIVGNLILCLSYVSNKSVMTKVWAHNWSAKSSFQQHFEITVFVAKFEVTVASLVFEHTSLLFFELKLVSKLPFSKFPYSKLKAPMGKGKTIAGVSSQFYHHNFIIAVLSSQFYHRSFIVAVL